MSPLVRILCLALVSLHVVAASTPCADLPRAAEERAPAASHGAMHAVDGHGAMHAVDGHAAMHGVPAAAGHGAMHAARSADADAHGAHAPHHGHPAPHPAAHSDPPEPPVSALAWNAPCPCGCDREAGDEVPGRALDPALRLAPARAPAAFAAIAFPAAAPRLPTARPELPDPVPLSA